MWGDCVGVWGDGKGCRGNAVGMWGDDVGVGVGGRGVCNMLSVNDDKDRELHADCCCG